MMGPNFPYLIIESPPSRPGVHVLTMNKSPENRLTVDFAQTVIAALRYIETKLMRPDFPGAVVISSISDKFWCTGLELEEADSNIFANSDGFYPLLATLLDYPYPTITLVTGHTFGGACPFMLSCDYRIMNSKRSFIRMPPINLGLHYDDIGALPRLKLHPDIARKMLLEAHRWTGEAALKDGIVDEIAPPRRTCGSGPSSLPPPSPLAPPWACTACYGASCGVKRWTSSRPSAMYTGSV